MAKKSKAFENTDGQPTQAPHPMNTEAQNAEAAAKTPLIRPTSHLVMSTPDILGRTAYRFAKCAEMPKKAARYPVYIDGKEGEIAFTTSGGYSEVVAYNAYITKPAKDDGSPGDIGWILFNDGVDPFSKEQFPDGYHFTTTEGPCAANPVRQPKNVEAETRRREASAAAAKLRKEAREKAEAEAKAAEPQVETTEGLDATQ